VDFSRASALFRRRSAAAVRDLLPRCRTTHLINSSRLSETIRFKEQTQADAGWAEGADGRGALGSDEGAAARPAVNVEQLRRDIDRGKTGDKIAADDPAAVPLGADDEAAGMPVSPSIAAMAHAQELKPPHLQASDTQGMRYAWVLFAAAAVIAVIVVVAGIVLHPAGP
jgi:hypothetical protein